MRRLEVASLGSLAFTTRAAANGVKHRLLTFGQASSTRARPTAGAVPPATLRAGAPGRWQPVSCPLHGAVGGVQRTNVLGPPGQ